MTHIRSQTAENRICRFLLNLKPKKIFLKRMLENYSYLKLIFFHLGFGQFFEIFAGFVHRVSKETNVVIFG